MNDSPHDERFGTRESALPGPCSHLEQLNDDVGTSAACDGVGARTDSMNVDAAISRATNPQRRTLVPGAGVENVPWIGVGATALTGATSRRANSLMSTDPFACVEIEGDLVMAAVAAGLENLVIFAYRELLAAVNSGRLAVLSPAVGSFVTVALGQHADHAKAWNSVLRANHQAPVTVVDPQLAPAIEHRIKEVTNVAELTKLALDLETIVAETYRAQTSTLQSATAIGLSSSIQPVEMQHVALLQLMRGEYPGVRSVGSPLACCAADQAHRE